MHFYNPSTAEWIITAVTFVVGAWCGAKVGRWHLRRQMAKTKK